MRLKSRSVGLVGNRAASVIDQIETAQASLLGLMADLRAISSTLRTAYGPANFGKNARIPELHVHQRMERIQTRLSAVEIRLASVRHTMDDLDNLDPNAFVQAVLREPYLDDQLTVAKHVRSVTEATKQIRYDLAALRRDVARTASTLGAVGDDAQLANVDLQNNLQKQQQSLQLLSNIAKLLNDTAMAIIRKMGG